MYRGSDSCSSMTKYSIIVLVLLGFPFPAVDYLYNSLDLNQYLVPRPATTFFFRVDNDVGCYFGFVNGDLLVVDRSIDVSASHLAITVFEGEFCMVQLCQKYRDVIVRFSKETILLLSDIEIEIWGVVIGLVRKLPR